MGDRNIANIIRKFAAKTPNTVAIKFGSRHVSWRELDERSSRAASGLETVGLSSQQRIAFLAKNCPEYFEVSFGAAKLNAVVVAINWRLTPAEIAYTINDAGARVLIVGPDFLDIVAQLRHRLTTVAHIVAIGEHPDYPSYARWLASSPATDPCAPVQDQDICLQLYTSGTTGLPKGVLTANANLFALVGKVQAAWRLDRSSVNLVCMPLFHIAGCAWALAGMDLGATSVLTDDFNAEQILDLMQIEGVTNALFVPAMLGFMTRVPAAGVRR